LKIAAEPVAYKAIEPWRDCYRQEMACQIVHDSLHARGFSNMFLLTADGEAVGHGCVLGYGDAPKDIVGEFYLTPAVRSHAHLFFRALIEASGARTIEAQTNDHLLMLMMLEFAPRFKSDRIVFEAGVETQLAPTDATFRKINAADRASVFKHTVEGVGDWVIEHYGEVVATGGWLTHYNPPFCDLYMEVQPRHRRRGYGSFLIQELKREAREAGYTPAARCNLANEASRATLQRAGMVVCARVVAGPIAV
jgi:GNAT superfamily N-acetyltransferase